MRKLAGIAIITGALGWCGIVAGVARAAPLFSECPAVGSDSGCQYLVTVTDLTTSIARDPSQPSYASNLAATHESGAPTDALIGVRNNSSQPLTHLNISGSITFEFDGDGLCDNASGAVPAGCQPPGGPAACGSDAGTCAFPPPPGEPAAYREPGALPGTPPFPAGTVQNGYEGPTTWFSNVAPSPENSGTVNFSPALAPGSSTYLSLEAPPGGLPLTTQVSLRVGAGGMAGPTLYLPSGLWIHSRAMLTGPPGHPHGQMSFQVFGDRVCARSAEVGWSRQLGADGISAISLQLRRPGTYYLRVGYAGDGTYAPAQTPCGDSIVVVPRPGQVGLPAPHRCVAVVRATLRMGRRRARSALVFVGGRVVRRRAGRISLRVHRRLRVAVLASSQPRAFGARPGVTRNMVQQTRTYRSCRG